MTSINGFPFTGIMALGKKSKKEPRDHPLTKSTREDLRNRINEFDKYLISGDARRKEPKKFGGPGARRRKQKSYR